MYLSNKTKGKISTPKKTQKKKVRKGIFNRRLFHLVALVAVIGCSALMFTVERDCREKEKELAGIQEKIDVCKMENAELQRTLDSDDLSSYIERIALEERGYAYPDERRFYDTSRD